MNPRLVIVSNRLPVSVKKVNGTFTYEQSIGGLATGLAPYAKNKQNRWIGWPGIATDDLTEDELKEITRELKRRNCYPVFLNQKQLDSYYNGYCNSFLWPLFHDIAIPPKVKKLEAEFWKSYVQINKKVAEITLSLSNEQDRIWIHDYHLLLLPKYLRRERPTEKLGLFMHIPFPDTKRFAKLENAKELVSGMIESDLVGFHTQSYVHNFLDNLEALTSLAVESNKVIRGTKVTEVTDFPIGIDYTKYKAAIKNLSIKKDVMKLYKKYGRKKVIFALDRLDPAKGLVERVAAYRKLLQQYPKFRNKVVFAMVVAPSRTDIEAYMNLKVKLEKLVEEVNAEFGTRRWQPIDYMYTSLPFEKVTPFYQRAEVAFIVPLRDGMNLVAKEYLASKKRQNGVLILSKTAGAAEDLREAVVVDPHRIDSVVEGLHQALTMPKNELRRRVKNMQLQISNATIQKWASSFIDTLKTERSLPLPKPLTRSLTATLETQISSAYKNGNSRVLLLDYDGVLEPIHRNPDNAMPSKKLTSILTRLGQVAKVVIISGRSKHDLGLWFSHLPVSLVAEHGMYIKGSHESTWHTTKTLHLKDWKQEVETLLTFSAKNAPGSFVEVKDSSIAWHYRGASSYHAQKYLVILNKFLKPIVRKYDLQVAQGHNILEIRPKSVNKGKAVLRNLSNKTDFILCIGDDYTDEDMFEALPSTAYTIKVGRGRTAAKYRVSDVASVLHLLSKLKG